ncbi:MAG TPA: tetratricopeptide repeat protein [Gemmatimonadales bacterium]|nr:tetratricopeptide repeat protein [Gemmatimonadales bacterium]
MSDDIRALTARLADEPTSLAFLELGEALRRRGQYEAAAKVARGGLSRYPGLADAHDLVARILSDQGDLAGAFDAWADALRLDPLRSSALKGLAFLYFRAGDVPAALEHLARAAEADPDDVTIPAAIARMERTIAGQGEPPEAGPPAPQGLVSMAPLAAPSAPAEAPTPVPPAVQPAPVASADSPFADFSDGERGLLLADANGLRLGGTLAAPGGGDAGDRVAAELGGVVREAGRASRLLGLGSWHSIAIETPAAFLVLVPPSGETVLLASREPSMPMARLGLLAERAARVARRWLERGS